MSEYTTVGDIDFTFDAKVGYGDLSVEDRDLQRETGLRSAFTISLYSNCRADDEDNLPDSAGSREGWWADELLETDDKIGSKLWLLGRQKMKLNELLPRAEQYVKEALDWTIQDGLVAQLGISVSKFTETSIKINIKAIRPETAQAEFFTFFYNWKYELEREG